MPSQIGRYAIKSRMARGGMGDLYLGHDPQTNRLVAIKLLNATLDSSELRQRFEREAHALAALNHPNIVNIYDTGEYQGSPFIVMEYVRGETLAEMIKRRAPMSVPQKLKLMADLCSGLAEAHGAGIVHRDIKPANLMVDQQGRLKILDFGIVRFAAGDKTLVGLPLTQVNALLGTPGYMSPEQIEGRNLDHRSDIFAAGAVCYELFAHTEAFSGSDTLQIQRQVLQGQPAPLASIVPGLDPEIEEIVLRALKRDPDERYQHAETFEKALERVRSRLGPDAPGPPHGPTPPPPQNAGGKLREVRAEAAYQRALQAFEGRGFEAARRFAVEALAEDPSHARARQLLASIDAQPPLAAQAAETEQAGPTPMDTSAGTVAPTITSAPTILVTPKGAGWKKSHQDTVVSRFGPLKNIARRLWSRDRTSWKGHGSFKGQGSFWMRHQRALQAVALLFIVVSIVAFATRFGSWFPQSGPLLTITKPSGGTIIAVGIRCGTSGAECTAHPGNGTLIEVKAEPDRDFAFDGYTGDCAPGGLITMTAPRVCGARFVHVSPAPLVSPQSLTIDPPNGGTLTGLDGLEIKCGTSGSVCSANLADGSEVTLVPTPDLNYMFAGFSGDCDKFGKTKMIGPRTCGATFTRTDQVSARRSGPPPQGAPPQVPPPQGPPPAPPKSQDPPPKPPAQSAPDDTASPSAPQKLDEIETAEQFAKRAIRGVLEEYCRAIEALAPGRVHAVYPTADIKELLNKKRYNSAQCKFGEPEFVSLEPAPGKGTVRADLTTSYDYTAASKPKEPSTATVTLYRDEPRGPWRIREMNVVAKKK